MMDAGDNIEYQTLNNGHGIFIKRDFTHGKDPVGAGILGSMMQAAPHTLAQQCFRIPPQTEINEAGEVIGAQGYSFIYGHRGLPAIPGATLIAEIEYISQN